MSHTNECASQHWPGKTGSKKISSSLSCSPKRIGRMANQGQDIAAELQARRFHLPKLIRMNSPVFVDGVALNAAEDNLREFLL
jgi:hypothetical protein